MIATIKAELRKLFTVRSTYALIGIVALFAIFISGYAKGYKLDAAGLLDPLALQDSIVMAITITSVFGAIIGILLMSHEYRYSTILYTLTSSRSRTVVLAAKVLVITALSLVLTVLVSLLAVAATTIGLHIAGSELAPQSLYYSDFVWRCLLYGWGNAMFALIIAALLRSQVAALITFFMLPTTIESLLALILKNNTSYLPFTALGGVISKTASLSYERAAATALIYIVVGGAVSWALFLRRDAN